VSGGGRIHAMQVIGTRVLTRRVGTPRSMPGWWTAVMLVCSLVAFLGGGCDRAVNSDLPFLRHEAIDPHLTLSADPLVRALERFYGGSECDDYQTYLDALVRKLNLEDKVRFIGKVAHKELPAWYRAATVVVNPSLSESFGISIVEGMACGIPVVGTKVGGMLETIVDGETGLSVDAERPDLLADALLEVLGSPEKADTMGRHGRQRAVEGFSWRARADRLIATYRAIGA